MSKKIMVIVVAMVVVFLSVTASRYQKTRIDYFNISTSSVYSDDKGSYLVVTGSYGTSCYGKDTVRYVKTKRGMTLQIYKTSPIKKTDNAYCDGNYYPGLIDTAYGCACQSEIAEYIIPIN